MNIQEQRDRIKVLIGLHEEVLLAPNGKPSLLTKKLYKLVRTQEFKNWFGDWENQPSAASKVVDENGEPLVVWHENIRGDNEFTVFKPTSYGTLGEHGFFYFARDKKWVKNFSKKYLGFGGSRPFFLNIRSALDMGEWKTLDGWMEFLDENNLLTDTIRNRLASAPRSRFYEAKYPAWTIYRYDMGEFRDKLMSNGYDGIVQVDSNYGRTNDLVTYAALEPRQIKLATGFNVKFDPKDSDIGK